MKIERDIEGIGYPGAPHVEIAKVFIRSANKMTFLYLKPPSETQMILDFELKGLDIPEHPILKKQKLSFAMQMNSIFYVLKKPPSLLEGFSQT